jgi:hypothetical protein
MGERTSGGASTELEPGSRAQAATNISQKKEKINSK